MKKSLFLTALLTATLAMSAQAQVDHLQCHKVKDTNQFKAAVVDLTAIQALFELPDNCTIKGKAVEFCVPTQKAGEIVKSCGSVRMIRRRDLPCCPAEFHL